MRRTDGAVEKGNAATPHPQGAKTRRVPAPDSVLGPDVAR